jgi:uncharacterized repeat protein (TIGR01451 family)
MRMSLWLALIGVLAIASLGASDVSLPQNLWIASGTRYEDFENSAEWTPAHGSVSNNSSEYKSGTQSVKLTADASQTATMTKAVNWDLSSSAIQQIQFWAYQHNVLADYRGSLILSLSNDASFSNYFRVWLLGSRMRSIAWHRLVWAKAWFKVGAGSPSWDRPIVRVRFQISGSSGVGPSYSIDDLQMGAQSRPAVMLTFDDAEYSSQYATDFPIMRQHGIRGTAYPISIEEWGALTWDQLREMAAAGWTIGNHTRTHPHLTQLTEDQQETELADAMNDLTAHELGAGAKHVAYPYGEFDDDTMTAMSNLGMWTGRTTEIADVTIDTPYPAWVLPNIDPYDLYHLPGHSCRSGDSLAALEEAVDAAISGGTILPLLFHNVGQPTDPSVADFKALIEYIAARRNYIDAITMDDLYRLTQGPVTVPKMAAGTLVNVSAVPSATYRGQPITYTIAYTNAGTGPVRDIVITDRVPIELMNARYTSSGAPITPTGAMSYAWDVAELEVGEGGFITLTGVVSPSLAPGVFTNTVTLDGPTDSATSSAESTVLSSPVLSIAKTVTPTAGVANQGVVTYTIVVANSGYEDASGVFVTDTLPVSTTFAGWVGEPGGASAAGDLITWQGSVAAGQSLTWTFVASHTGGYGDVVVNTVRYGHPTGSGSAQARFAVTPRWFIRLPLIVRGRRP